MGGPFTRATMHGFVMISWEIRLYPSASFQHTVILYGGLNVESIRVTELLL